MDDIAHGILQARILEWVAFPFSRGSSQPRDRTQVSRIAGGFFTSWATREAQDYWSVAYLFSSRSYQLRNRTGVSCIAGGIFTSWAIREVPSYRKLLLSTKILVMNKIPLFECIEKSEDWIILRSSSKTQLFILCKKTSPVQIGPPLHESVISYYLELLRVLYQFRDFLTKYKRNTTALKWTASDSPFMCDETINKKWRQNKCF